MTTFAILLMDWHKIAGELREGVMDGRPAAVKTCIDVGLFKAYLVEAEHLEDLFRRCNGVDSRPVHDGRSMSVGDVAINLRTGTRSLCGSFEWEQL